MRDSPLDSSRNRLLARTSETEDPVSLLQTSGRRFVPVNTAWNSDISNDPSEVPSSEDRPSATEIIEEMQKHNWYKDQIVFRQETEEKAARSGVDSTFHFPRLAPYMRIKEPLEHLCRRPSWMLCPVRDKYPPFTFTKQRQSMHLRKARTP